MGMFTGALPLVHAWTPHVYRRRHHRTLSKAIRHSFCGLWGHEYLFETEPGRVFLRCADCGRETPGWHVGTAAAGRARR